MKKFNELFSSLTEEHQPPKREAANLEGKEKRESTTASSLFSVSGVLKSSLKNRIEEGKERARSGEEEAESHSEGKLSNGTRP